jgi:hypothetical protein
MNINKITKDEIQAAVASKGYYPKETPIENYDPAFIEGVLIGAWDQVKNIALEMREKLSF